MKASHRARLVALCAMPMMGVLLVASKEAMAFLPNFEPVSLLVILFTLTCGPLVWGALGVFLLLEGLFYGFGFWWIMYLYIWPLLALLTWLLRRMNRAWQWALFSGLFGLAFGTLCSFAYLPAGGVAMMFAWAVSGLPFDGIHGAGNFLLMLILYRPLRTVLDRLRQMAEKMCN